jgi:hypothetical protein
MEIMQGHSKQIISSNIREMIKSGRTQNQAIAAALASARNSKRVAETANPEESQATPEAVGAPETDDREKMLAKALYRRGEQDEISSYSTGATPEVNSPDPIEPAPEEEFAETMPHKKELTEAAQLALAEKKRTRHFT